MPTSGREISHPSPIFRSDDFLTQILNMVAHSRREFELDCADLHDVIDRQSLFQPGVNAATIYERAVEAV